MNFKKLNEAMESFSYLRDRTAVSKGINNNDEFEEVYDIGEGFYIKIIGCENSYGEDIVTGAQIVKPIEIKVTQFESVD